MSTSSSPDLLFFIGSLDIGGTERHISQIAPSLAQRGWSVEVVVLREGGGFTKTITDTGIPIKLLSSGVTTNIPKLRGALALTNQSVMLAQYLRTNTPKILHCFLPTCCQIGAMAAWKSGLKNVCMSRRSQAIRPSLFPGDKTFELLALKRAIRVFGHSQAVIDELRQDGLCPDRLVLNHNGIDASLFNKAALERKQTRQIQRWPEETVIYVCVANLIPYKGHKDLLNAFGIHARNTSNWRLILIGMGTPEYREELIALTHELSIAEQVDFLGHQQNIPQLLNSADVGILASHQEGFPNTLLEYMAAELPVIATSVGGNVDIVVPNSTGVLVPPGQPNHLAAAIKDFHYLPRKRLEFGLAGRKLVERNFSLESCINRYDSVYRDILKGKD